LVVTAGQTARQDPVQQMLHDEIAAAVPRSVRRTVEHAGHFELLSDQWAAGQVADWVHEFVDTLGTTQPRRAAAKRKAGDDRCALKQGGMPSPRW
jgi:hypothetical protein